MLKRFMLPAVVVAIVVTAGAFAGAQQTAAHSHAKAGAKAEDQAQPDAKAQSDSKSKAAAKVKQVYTIDCAMCHGANGDGNTDIAKDMHLTLSNWTDPKALADKTDQEIFDKIRKGNDKMPPEDKSRATDDEVKGLIVYIRGFSKGQTAAPAAAPAEAPAASAGTPPPSN